MSDIRYAIIDGYIQDFANSVEVPLYEDLPDLLSEGWDGDLMLGKDLNSEKQYLFVTKDVISESSHIEDLKGEGTIIEIVYRAH